MRNQSLICMWLFLLFLWMFPGLTQADQATVTGSFEAELSKEITPPVLIQR